MPIPLIALGLGAAAASGLVNTIVSNHNASRQNQIANNNFELQRDQYEYQKQLNQLTMEREDTAVQRRADDLIAAGLDPSLAAGSAASSSTFSSAPAPQREQTKQAEAFDIMQTMMMATDFATSATNASSAWHNAEIAKAQAGNIHQKLANDLAMQVATQENLKGQASKMAIESAIMNHDLSYLKRWNVPSNVHPHVQLATQIYDASVGNPKAKEAIDKITNYASDTTSNVVNGVRTVIGNVSEAAQKAKREVINKSKEKHSKANDKNSNMSQQERNAMKALNYDPFSEWTK